ncbi:unnamed protein product [Knipowitschia caucasica]
MASSQVRLRILPSVRCLFDKPVQVKVEGLSPHAPVVLRSKVLDDRGVVFRAEAQYQADHGGHVDASRDPSLGGSYTGVEPMGLFWSMLPETPHNKLLKKSALTPMQVQISALSGETVLATEVNQREFMPEGMRRIPVREGRLRGVLFVPPGPGPFPGIVDLYTFGGGLSEPRASLLACKGFVVLALAYKGYEDLPKNPEYLDLEYFEEGVTYLRSQPQVAGSGVGVISISHSGGLALSMASFLDHIAATVCVNGCNANTVIPLRYRDLVLPPLQPVLENVSVLPDSGLLNGRHAMPDPLLHPSSLIPIQRATSHFLLAASEDDHNWESALYARQAAAILKSHGKDTCSLAVYSKSGHFLEAPHMPFCPSAVHAVVGRAVAFGGEARAHAQDQLHLWERVQRFFKRHLGDLSL